MRPAQVILPRLTVLTMSASWKKCCNSDSFFTSEPCPLGLGHRFAVEIFFALWVSMIFVCLRDVGYWSAAPTLVEGCLLEATRLAQLPFRALGALTLKYVVDVTLSVT